MLRACIVGTGPSGMYSAKYLLKQWPANCGIDLIERLPIPYGLVRFGVAPDHPEVKSVQNDFDEVAKDPRIRYFGNVDVGKDVSIEQLKQRYDVVLLACGADHDRELGLKGEHKFIRGARDFVAWYNGHPEVSAESCNYFEKTLAESESCVVVGNGNVALDCARILLAGVDKLKSTDIADRALEALSRSRVKSVSVVGRRAHPQASFTMKELRELTKMENVAFRVSKSELDLGVSTEASRKEIETQRPVKRMDALLRETVAQPTKSGLSREVVLRFLLTPTELISSDSALTALRFEKNILTGPANHQAPKGTGQFEDIPCQMVLRSVGYKAVPIEPSLPFDTRKGIVVTKEGGRVNDGLYAVGWLKRGPSGIIGTNIPDAHEAVDAIVTDTPSFQPQRKQQFSELAELLKEKRVKVVDWTAAKKIEEKEEIRGAQSNPPRPRVKFESVAEMLKAAEIQ